MITSDNRLKVTDIEDLGILLDDGAYDLTGISYKVLEDTEEPSKEQIDEWLAVYPEGVVAIPYQGYTTFLLSRRPPQLKNENMIGMSFFKYNPDDKREYFQGMNDGAAAIIENCPRTILICAESD